MNGEITEAKRINESDIRRMILIIQAKYTMYIVHLRLKQSSQLMKWWNVQKQHQFT